jgi:hypothetical protein
MPADTHHDGTSVGSMRTDELVLDAVDLDEALARTKARHAQLLAARRRRTGMVAGLAAVLVVGAAGVFALGRDDTTRVGTDLGVANETDSDAKTSEPTAVPPAELGTAVVVRRDLELDGFAVRDSSPAVVVVRVRCELAGETLTDVTTAWDGPALTVDAVVQSEHPEQSCAGVPLELEVPVPDGVDPARITVSLAED